MIELLIAFGIYGGYACIAYVLSELLSKVVRKIRLFAKLLIWSFLIPLFLGLGMATIWFLISMSEPQHSMVWSPWWAFYIVWFRTAELAPFLFLFWFVGVLFILRKNLVGLFIGEG